MSRAVELIHRAGGLAVMAHPGLNRDDSLVPWANVAYMERLFPAGMVVEVMDLADRDHFVIWNAVEVVRGAVQRLAVR